MPTPDYADPQPVYAQIARDLRSRIGSGEFPEGGRVPSNKALAGYYRVAAGTIRQALDVLRRDGMISTQSTRGTFVIRQRSETTEQDGGVLQRQVPQLRDEVRRLADRVESLELNVAELYSRQGQDYPRESAAGGEDSSRAVAHDSRA